jgi:2-polyprenyl-6-methoxyphenol hydroxylase-like FAD-dependent oxidoreductase
MSNIKRIVIIGGGIGGMTLGLALRRAGIPFVIHEKYDHFQHLTTAFLIWSYAAKELLALHVPMDAVAAPLETLEVHGRTGSIICEMPVGEISRRHGAESYEVNRKRLAMAMADMLGEDLNMGSCCTGVETLDDRAVATFADGSTDEGDVIVGCDGASSTVRRILHPNAELDMFGSGGWIAVIGEHPEGLQPNTQMEFWQPGVKAGIADIGNGECRWYVAMHSSMPSRESAPLIEHVKAAMPNAHPVLQAAMDATPDDRLVLTFAGDLLALDPWFAGRVVMLGDSAHATSPYAGMGACTAIVDAVDLAARLQACTTVGVTLQAFQDARKPVSDAVITKSRGGLDLAASHSHFKAWIRDLKFSHIPPKAMDSIVTTMVCGEEPH